MTRVVRRYGNRKLYDTHARRYVTLDGLRLLVASGHDVEVVDQATGEDLTSLTLAQVILEGVRERTARIPRQVLAAIVRLGAGT
ncbi:MAG TPA: polyhydroxyalkanoate synthesis regulator DNA-binding domain-containing protein, partial [Vicinamibacteria bacterium]